MLIYRMKLLELFVGTGSVGNVFKDKGWVVVSLDRDMDADIKMDIMDWNYQAAFEPGHFDVIWSSLPCTEYSIAKSVGVRKIDEANKIVERTLEIINYFNPRYWFLENPQSGKLKEQRMMNDLSYIDVDYCKYGMPYRKRTRIWNNLDTWAPRPLCKKYCNSMMDNGRKHKEVAQRVPTDHVQSRDGEDGDRTSYTEYLHHW
jgi:site-specific DNA-cytosine methylase